MPTGERSLPAETLNEALDRFFLALLKSPIPMTVARRQDGAWLRVNDAMLDLIGFSREEVIGRTPVELGLVEPMKRVAALKEVRRSGSSGQTEVELRTKTGEIRHVIASVTTIEMAGESCLLATNLDITERKRMEIFREGQNRILEMMTSGTALPDVLRTLLRLIEGQGKGMLGSVLLLAGDGVHIRQGLAPSLPESFAKAFDGCPIGPKAGSCGTAMYRAEQVIVSDIARDPLWDGYRHIAARYALVSCWSTPILSRTGVVLGSFAMYYREPRTPTPSEEQLIGAAVHMAGLALEKDRVEAALRESRERLLGILDILPTALLLLEPGAGEVRFANAAAKAMTGGAFPASRPGEECLDSRGRPIPPEESPDRQAARGRKVTDFEMAWGPAGARRTMLVNSDLWHDAAGAPATVVLAMQDLTGLKAVEEQFRQAQKMEAVGHLAGGIAHDFNNLLTAVNGFSEMAMQGLGLAHPVYGHIREILRAGDRAAGLTKQLLAYSRKQVLELRAWDLGLILRELTGMLQRFIGDDVVLSAAPAEGPQWVAVDRGQIEQVIMNLVVNARDAMPRGGRIRLEAGPMDIGPGSSPLFPDAAPGAYVHLSVADTGTGMDAAVMARIFEPFYTTKEPGKGTGLGLSVVQGIVRQSGGAVTVRSGTGAGPSRPSGTTFHILLPRALAPAAAAAAGQPPSDSFRGDETLLLVEDEPVVLGLACRVLEALGYRVLQAPDGVEALRIVTAHPGEIRLVVTDVVMPDMGGRDLADRIRALEPGLPVLLMSGNADWVGESSPLDASGGMLSKPFSPGELARRVRELLDLARAQPPR